MFILLYIRPENEMKTLHTLARSLSIWQNGRGISFSVFFFLISIWWFLVVVVADLFGGSCDTLLLLWFRFICFVIYFLCLSWRTDRNMDHNESLWWPRPRCDRSTQTHVRPCRRCCSILSFVKSLRIKWINRHDRTKTGKKEISYYFIFLWMMSIHTKWNHTLIKRKYFSLFSALIHLHRIGPGYWTLAVPSDIELILGELKLSQPLATATGYTRTDVVK